MRERTIRFLKKRGRFFFLIRYFLNRPDFQKSGFVARAVISSRRTNRSVVVLFKTALLYP